MSSGNSCREWRSVALMPHLWTRVRVSKRRLIKDGFHQVLTFRFLLTTMYSPAFFAASVPAHEEVGLLKGLACQAAVERSLGTGIMT